MNLHKKSIVALFMVFLFLLAPITTVYANEGQTSSYVTLKFRIRGVAVTRLQQALVKQGYLKDSPDGIYGLKTERAVIDFQIAKKLRIDGIAGRETQTALFTQPVSRGTTHREDDLYWLSRIIHAESEAESYQGKVAVGSVVLNRVRSKSFPNTVKGVIFEYTDGIPQFCPVEEGTIYNAPNQDSINAARDALNNVKPVGDSQYFFNPDKSAGRWIVRNKTYVTKIGNHVFYK